LASSLRQIGVRCKHTIQSPGQCVAWAELRATSLHWRPISRRSGARKRRLHIMRARCSLLAAWSSLLWAPFAPNQQDLSGEAQPARQRRRDPNMHTSEPLQSSPLLSLRSPCLLLVFPPTTLAKSLSLVASCCSKTGAKWAPIWPNLASLRLKWRPKATKVICLTCCMFGPTSSARLTCPSRSLLVGAS